MNVNGGLKNAADNASVSSAFEAWRSGSEAVAGVRKVFLTGVAKSGTTWLMTLLNAHPEAVIRGEGGFAWRLLPLLQQATGAFNKHCEDNRLAEVTKIGNAEFAAIFRQVVLGRLAEYARDAGTDPASLKLIGDKTPQHALAMPALAQAFPEAVFVNIVRDPRDVAVSAWHHFVKRTAAGTVSEHNQPTLAEYATKFIRESWAMGVTAALNAQKTLGDRVLQVRYEDLHAKPDLEMQRVIRFCGLSATPARLESMLSAGSFERLSGGRERGEEDASNFYRKGIVGDWGNHMTLDQAAFATREIGPIMDHFGYATEKAGQTA